MLHPPFVVRLSCWSACIDVTGSVDWTLSYDNDMYWGQLFPCSLFYRNIIYAYILQPHLLRSWWRHCKSEQVLIPFHLLSDTELLEIKPHTDITVSQSGAKWSSLVLCIMYFYKWFFSNTFARSSQISVGVHRNLSSHF